MAKLYCKFVDNLSFSLTTSLDGNRVEPRNNNSAKLQAPLRPKPRKTPTYIYLCINTNKCACTQANVGLLKMYIYVSVYPGLGLRGAWSLVELLFLGSTRLTSKLVVSEEDKLSTNLQ